MIWDRRLQCGHAHRRGRGRHPADRGDARVRRAGAAVSPGVPAGRRRSPRVPSL